MKPLVKKTFLSISCLMPIALVCGFAVPWNRKQSIVCIGSSSIKPVVESMAKNFKSADITCEGCGSGYGISQVINGLTDIGLSSKNPYSNAQKSKTIWANKKIKTFTPAWEALCFIYIPPAGLSSYEPEYLNQLLTIVDVNNNPDSLSENDPSVLNLYYAFSGYGYQCYNPTITKKSPYKLSTFVDKNNALTKDIELLQKTNVLPYVRSGGALTSGTASAFYDCSHFTKFENGKKTQYLNNNQLSAFEMGTYGNDFKVYDTDEANSRAWDVFSKNNIPGSIIYLSSGFVSENYDLICKKYHYGIVTYNHIQYSTDNIGQGYNFFRPINLISCLNSTRSDNLSAEVKKFLSWLIFDTSDAEWKKIGLKKASDIQISSMCSVNSQYTKLGDKLFDPLSCDDNLMKERGQSWDQDDVTLGALE